MTSNLFGLILIVVVGVILFLLVLIHLVRYYYDNKVKKLETELLNKRRLRYEQKK